MPKTFTELIEQGRQRRAREPGVFVGGEPVRELGRIGAEADPWAGVEERGLIGPEEQWAEGLSEEALRSPDIQTQLADLIATGKVRERYLERLPAEMRARAQPRAGVEVGGRRVEGTPQEVIEQLAQRPAPRGAVGGGLEEGAARPMSVAEVQAREATRLVEERTAVEEEQAKQDRLRTTRFQDEEDRRITATAKAVLPRLEFVPADERADLAQRIATDVEKDIGVPPVTGAMARARFVPRHLREKMERYEERRRKKIEGHVQFQIFEQKWRKQLDVMDSQIQSRVSQAEGQRQAKAHTAELRRLSANAAEYRRVQQTLKDQGDQPDMATVRRLYSTGAGGLEPQGAFENVAKRAGWNDDQAAFMAAYNDQTIQEHYEVMSRGVTDALEVDGRQVERMKDALRRTSGDMRHRIDVAVSELPKGERDAGRRLAMAFAREIALSNMERGRIYEQEQLSQLSGDEGLQNWLGGFARASDAESFAARITGDDLRLLQDLPSAQAGKVLTDAILDRPELRDSPYAERWLAQQRANPESDVSALYRQWPAALREVQKNQHTQDYKNQQAEESKRASARAAEVAKVDEIVAMSKQGRVHRIGRGDEKQWVRVAGKGMVEKKKQPGFYPADDAQDFEQARQHASHIVNEDQRNRALIAITAAQTQWTQKVIEESARRSNWFRRITVPEVPTFEEIFGRPRRPAPEDIEVAEAERTRRKDRIRILEEELKKNPGEQSLKDALDKLKAQEGGA